MYGKCVLLHFERVSTAKPSSKKGWKFWNRDLSKLNLIKNSSKIKKWWSKFKKNVMLKKQKQQQTNKNSKATALRMRT